MNSDYNIAVHALVYLSHKGEVLPSEALAENICTNPARVRKVMAKLAHAGIIITREGRPHGGYALGRQASEINLQQVAAALGGSFIDIPWKSGDRDMACMVASGMADVMDGIYAQMNQCCGAYLAGITIHDIEDKIFHTNAEGTP